MKQLLQGCILHDMRSNLKYEILGRIGEGGFGVVYKALRLPHMDSPSELVAIKTLDKHRLIQSKLQDRVREEICVHAKLHHASIVQMLNAFEDDDHINIVLEYCPAGDLGREVKRRVFTELEAAEVIRQIGQGLQYLHSNNILHRDLTMSNILMQSFAGGVRYKIADFGLAVQLKRPTETHLTICGTPNSISPEVASEEPYGLGADVWGLGIILYTLLIGRPPFDDGVVKSTLQRVIHQHPELPSCLSTNAIHLINGMLQKNTGARFTLDQVLNHPMVSPRSQASATSCMLLPHSMNRVVNDSGLGTSSLTGVAKSSVSDSTARAGQAKPVLSLPSNAGSQRRLTAPINATRLRPGKLRQIKPGVSACIAASGEVNATFTTQLSTEKWSISPDGRQVKVDKVFDGGSLVKVHKYDTLPRSLWQKYNFIAKYVQCVRESTPRLTWYTPSAVVRLMEDGQTVQINFDSQTLASESLGDARIKTVHVVPIRTDVTAPPGIQSQSEVRIKYVDDSVQVVADGDPELPPTVTHLVEQIRNADRLVASLSQSGLADPYPATFGRYITLPSGPSSVGQVQTVQSGSTIAQNRVTPSDISYVSVQSNRTATAKPSDTASAQYRAAYRSYRFQEDGTCLEMPRDTRDTVFRYRNKAGIWETNASGASAEMQDKISRVYQMFAKMATPSTAGPGGSCGSAQILTM